MPIYEFYCPDCNTVYSFLSRRISDSIPSCPGCNRPELTREVSLFSSISSSSEDRADGPADDPRVLDAMESLAHEAESVDPDDPKQAAALMRKLASDTGLEYGDSLNEAITRLESGEDPDAIERDLGSSLEGDEDIFAQARSRARRSAEPRRDPKLYDM